MRRILASCALLGLVTAGVACDDGGGGGEVLTEAEYIEAGDELCVEAEEAVEAALDDLATQFSEATDIDEDEVAALVTEAIVGIAQDTVDDFRELEGPEELTDDVDALLDEIQATLDEIEVDPTIFEGVDDPFAGFAELGFEECGSGD